MKKLCPAIRTLVFFLFRELSLASTRAAAASEYKTVTPLGGNS
jgi:hypothetical protein